MQVNSTKPLSTNTVTPSQARYTLFLLTAVYMLGYADRNIINLLIEPIKQEFQVSDLTIGLITGLGFTSVQIALGIPVARWADRASRVKILAGGVLVWSLMTGLSGFAASIVFLAVARIGVGAGEACLTGPSHSLLSDSYTKEQRPRAFSIMAAGGEVGVILAFLVCGWVSMAWGWRSAFFVAGLPGILVALLLLFTVKEPVRGGLDGNVKKPKDQSFIESCKTMYAQKSFVLAVIASMAFGLHFFAVQVWSAAFLQRIHGLNLGEVGTLIAILRTALSVTGAVAGGYIASYFVKKYGISWFFRVPAISVAVSGLALAGFLFAPTLPIAIFFLGLTFLTIGFQLGPVFSAVQTVSPSNCRALSATLFVSLTQLFGLGVGSAIVGAISDYFTSHYGDGALRYALLFPVVGAILSGCIYWLASNIVKKDFARIN